MMRRSRSKNNWRTILFLTTFVLGLFFYTVPVSGKNSQDDGKLISRENYQFPDYQTAVEKTDVENYAAKEDYEKAVADGNFEFSKLTYLSDSLKVKAYLYQPKKIDAKFPVIVFNRGSTVRGDIAPELVVFFNRLARAGFVVVAPLYRQSDGGEGRDEVGGADVNDLMNVVPLIKSLGFADAGNLFLYGESRGGIMTYLALKRNFPARAAAVFGAITDFEDYIKANARFMTPAVLSQLWPDYEQNKEKLLGERSAINWADSINAPILIMHGGGDPQVNPLHSLSMAEKLQSLGKTYQLKIYAGDNHILAKSQVERDRETINWFKSFLQEN
jgi:dipeptidyl aminopeptidase/acylaminoacyl peptidase